MYTTTNFLTKKAFKLALANNEKIGVFQYNDTFGNTEKYQLGIHDVTIEAPHYPRPHTWYSRVRIENGIVIKILS